MTVSSKTDEAVPALSKESVELRIGGQPVEVKDIGSLEHSPLFFSVLVDLSGSSRDFADRESAAASSLFETLSAGGNHGYLVLIKEGVGTNDSFIDPASVRQILGRFPAQSRFGPTALYDALIHAASVQLASMKVPASSRRAIFVLSDGDDTASPENLDETIEIVQREGIPIFAVGFSGSKEPRDSVMHGKEILKRLSGSTGGYLSFVGSSAQPDVRNASSQYDRWAMPVVFQSAGAEAQ